MSKVSMRELRNEGGRVIDRVRHGEVLTVTCAGKEVAEIRPLPARPASAKVLLDRWRRLPAVDPVRLRADLDAVLDASL